MLEFFKTLFSVNKIYNVFEYDMTTKMQHCSRALCPECKKSTSFELYFSGSRVIYSCTDCHWQSPMF